MSTSFAPQPLAPDARKRAWEVGLYREEALEIPSPALRECIVNALCHRDYDTTMAVSVAIFDDRVEVASPGGFPPGKTVASLEADHASNPRNPRIAKALYLTKTIESWGRGLRLIEDECRKAGSPPPRFESLPGLLRCIFPRPPATARKPSPDTSPRTDGTVAGQSGRSQRGSQKSSQKSSQKILEALRGNSATTSEELAKLLGTSRRAVAKHLASLQDSGRLKRIGPDNGGHWKVIDP